jgi:cytochrome c-type biogenesis protein CcmH/NrfG
MTSRLDAFRELVGKNPANVRARFGLACEAQKAGLWEEAAEHFSMYLSQHDDEGNGYGRFAESLLALDRVPEARSALERGIEAAQRFGHPGLADELSSRLEDLEGST